jgi:hypothetical protein
MLRYRDPLLLVAWGDLSYEEAALALGVPIGTVRSRLPGPGPACASTSLRSTRMNDMDLLANFRADVPERPVSPGTEHRFHAALHQTKRRFPIARVLRLLLHSRRVLVAPLAIGAAAALVLGLSPVTLAPAPRPLPARATHR